MSLASGLSHDLSELHEVGDGRWISARPGDGGIPRMMTESGLPNELRAQIEGSPNSLA